MDLEMNGSWNLGLVALSFAVATFGSYVALENVRFYRQQDGARLGWLLSGALAMGAGGIWSMHFIGMLALEMDMPVSYEPVRTVASMVIAILVTGVAFFLVGRSKGGVGAIVLGGLLMGIGVASMHYLGMAAMRMPAEIVYDQTLVAVSVLIAVVAATAALWLAFQLVERPLQMAIASLVMGVAVCAMHYTGMAAATMRMSGDAQTPQAEGIPSEFLGISIFVVVSAVLILMLRKALHEADVAATPG